VEGTLYRGDAGKSVGGGNLFSTGLKGGMNGSRRGCRRGRCFGLSGVLKTLVLVSLSEKPKSKMGDNATNGVGHQKMETPHLSKPP